ncbi:Transducin (beta)-like 1 X-linked receptor 1 [Orbilia ellipsospora]|uniref:Transducin (Beta)-like 1 X-linked receptor 1 n=1 Tax=Orbilia ellipsospora TaxID=2528407 RepID=A0AAV9XJM4_9PEZI
MIKYIVFSPDSKLLASQSSDENVRIWQSNTGALVRAFTNLPRQILSFTFPTNNSISFADSESLTTWDLAAGVQLNLIEGCWTTKIANFSPDRKLLVEIPDLGVIRMWDPKTGAQLGKFTWSADPGYTASRKSEGIIVISPDSALAAINRQFQFDIWDLATGSLLRTFNHKYTWIETIYIYFSKEGELIGLMEEPPWTHLTLQNLETGKVLQKLEFSAPVISAAIPPSAKYICLVSHGGELIFLDTDTQEVLQVFESDPPLASALSFSPDSRRLLVLTPAGTLEMWDLDLRSLIFRQRLDLFTVLRRDFYFSPNGKMIAAVSKQTITLLDSNTGCKLDKIDFEWGRLEAVAFLPDKIVALGLARTSVNVWDSETGALVKILKPHYDTTVKLVAISPSCKLAALVEVRSEVSFDDWAFSIWDLETGAVIWIKKSPAVKIVSFSPDSRMVLTVDSRETKLWDALSGDFLYEVGGYQRNVNAAHFSFDGRALALGLADATVRVCNTSPNVPRNPTQEHSRDITKVVFSADGNFAASRPDVGDIKIWDVSTEKPCHTFQHEDGRIPCVAISPSNELVLYNPGIRTIEAKSGVVQWSLARASYPLDLKISPDGKTLASTVRSWGLLDKIWLDNLDKGLALQLQGEGPLEEIQGLEFSPDGKLLASGSNTGMVILWDADTGVQRESIQSEITNIQSLAFAPGGELLAWISESYKIGLWNLATGNSRVLTVENAIVSRSIAISPDCQLLALAHDNSITILEIASDFWSCDYGKVTIQQLEVATSISKVSFSQRGPYLETDRGYLNIAPIYQNQRNSLEAGPCIFVKGEWITRDLKDELWLPHDFRPTCMAVYGKTFMFGHRSGQVSFMEFNIF